MNNLELINKLYKPYKITKVGTATVIESMEGKFVLKSRGKQNLKELFNYLSIRDFKCYPKLIDDSRNDTCLFEYVEDAPIPKDQKGIDMIKTVADLHTKTSYKKEVREDKYKEIYDNIKGNLIFYKETYNKMIADIEEEVFMSPSQYLFIRNSSKLFSQIAFCEGELDDWYEMVKDKRETRVSIVHNKLSLEHYLRSDKGVLISWEDAGVDSPVLDFYSFYEKEALNLEFSSILSEYISRAGLEEYEKKLLFILLCMPRDIKFKDTEFASCDAISESYDYVYRTEYLVTPYYSVDDKE